MLGCANDLQKKDLEITKGTLHGNDLLGRVKCPWPAVCSRKVFACVCSAILLAESSEALSSSGPLGQQPAKENGEEESV